MFRHRSQILRNAQGWHYARTFAANAAVLVEIDQATRERSDSGRARTAQATTASPPAEGPPVIPQPPPAPRGDRHTR